MNNSPAGEEKSTEEKANYRIPKASNLEKRLRHAVSNSITTFTVDLTQDMSNSTSNKARSAAVCHAKSQFGLATQMGVCA